MALFDLFNINTYQYLCRNCLLWALLFLGLVPEIHAKDSYNKADSIVLKVMESRDFYGKYIDEYDANVYIKGNTQIKKKNFLYRYAPDFLYLDRKGHNTFIESLIKVHYKSPNYFSQQILAVNGSRTHTEDIRERVMQFLNINVYNPDILDDQILLPGIKETFKYYRFEYISESDTLNHKIHKIKVIPKIRSTQLISGVFFVVDSLWTISKFDITGKLEFSKFRVETEFGFLENDLLLPLKTQVTFGIKLLGNETVNEYSATFEYNSIKKYTAETEPEKINYNLSEYFSIRIDTLPVVKDEQFWGKNRTIPLTPYEKSLIDTSHINAIKFSSGNSWDISRGFINPKRFRYSDSQMSYSGLLNPFKLVYSKLDGIVYWQQLKYRKRNKREQEWQLNPNIGFLFQRKQVYFSMPVNWLFKPERFGEIHFDVGNRNQTYNSTIIEKINAAIPDSINFDDFALEYFHHYRMNLEGKYEIGNGLLIRGGLHYDWYIPIKSKNKKSPTELRNSLEDDIDDDVMDIVRDNYKTFSPSFGLIWTPGQYYRINGRKKEYVSSQFPTFSIEYTWGIKGFMNSNSNYTKIEADIQQKIPIGLMQSLQYYVGGGKFVKTHSLYFANFNLFQKRNIPQSWDDPIGGVFHLLDGNWYDASNSYFQTHLMYEFPSSFLRLFHKVTKDIVKERIYVSHLYTPARPFYTELGYGVGNFIGNAGIFVSFNHGKQEAFGVKFAFELGK
jgi:hypothetical protein